MTDAALSGRLIAVVGPSGAGKDSVMQGMVQERPQIGLVQRVITRAPELGGEDFEPVSEAAFARRRAAGAFCLHWLAHGLHYGIPQATRDRVRAGEVLLVNLSRTVLEQAAGMFPGFLVLHVTARPETLAARLAGRGRETPEDMMRRLQRVGRSLAAGLPVATVPNDGPLEEAVATALALLHPVRA
jgi:ribose 1,5-bisphosphokinase